MSVGFGFVTEGFAAVRVPKSALVVAASAGALGFMMVFLARRPLSWDGGGAAALGSVSRVSEVGTAGANSLTPITPSCSSSSSSDDESLSVLFSAV